MNGEEPVAPCHHDADSRFAQRRVVHESQCDEANIRSYRILLWHIGCHTDPSTPKRELVAPTSARTNQDTCQGRTVGDGEIAFTQNTDPAWLTWGHTRWHQEHCSEPTEQSHRVTAEAASPANVRAHLDVHRATEHTSQLRFDIMLEATSRSEEQDTYGPPSITRLVPLEPNAQSALPPSSEK